MVRIEGSIKINRPVEVVFDCVADERNEPIYNPRMVHVDKLTPGPIGRGTLWAALVESRGKPMGMEIEVTDRDRPHRLASITRMSTALIKGVLVFERDGDGTLMRWQWDMEPKGSFRLLTPLIAVMGRRQERAIWTGLKSYLEGNGPRPAVT